MFEHRSHELLSRRQFILRQLRHFLVALQLILVALLIGATGYHYTAGLGWLDATYNATMILTGMGPVDTLSQPGAKIFAICYALFSGFVFITAAAVIAAPLVHRLLHSIHLDIQTRERRIE